MIEVIHTPDSSNAQSLILYTALLSDARAGLEFIKNDPTLPGHESLVKQFTDLVTSHENNINRLNSQIAENKAAALKDAEGLLDKFLAVYEIVKHWVKPDIKKWLELVIETAKKVIEILKK